MTKLTEDILRAQTCPFEVHRKMSGDILVVTGVTKKHVIMEICDNEYAYLIQKFLSDYDLNYKLPEPEPKLVTMYECIDRDGIVLFMDENFRQRQGNRFYHADEHAVRIPNGRTMQLDISSDPWKWVVE